VGDGVSHVKSKPLPRLGILPGVSGRCRTPRPKPVGVDVSGLVKAAVDEAASQSMSSLLVVDCVVLVTQSLAKWSSLLFSSSVVPHHSSSDSWLAILTDEQA
jgi:hypothetical protein